MRRLTFGALATAALALAIAVPPGRTTAVTPNHRARTSCRRTRSAIRRAGGYEVDPAKRAFVRVALFSESLTQGFYTVAIYDNDGDLFPIAIQILRGDGVTTALEFAGPTGEGIDVSRATDDTIYVCALTV
jgi:hypothetical protein